MFSHITQRLLKSQNKHCEFSILTGNQASSLIEYESPSKKDYNLTPESKDRDDIRFDVDYNDNMCSTNHRFNQNTKSNLHPREINNRGGQKSTLTTVRDDAKRSKKLSNPAIPTEFK